MTTPLADISADDIHIRLATPKDIDHIVAVASSTFIDTFGPPINPATETLSYLSTKLTRAQLLTELAHPHSTFWIALTPTHLCAGYAKANILDAQTEEQFHGQQDTAEVERLYVDKMFLGKRLGKRLMDTIVEHVKAQGRTKLWLGVWEKNERALAFYEKAGFERIGEHVFLFGEDPQTDFILQKGI
ncbi:prolyl aminopeptidase [Fimicolochytrium jonesii]|uniref:prolyl aminopeptidase n=1 Tax=Fimicolochytrium jonesii TaxID=1396493 RepID=UPI0022FE96C6|nr:prolyl aminopeptidase [Fimicolochytrium jonesii]KAI8817455.1 prolyl aminopeptidase [Fimicolochytrium jonesii]